MSTGRFELGYVPALDGIRGVAILLVMIFHTEVPFLKGGYIGVDIFFVLSGFLITTILIKEFDRANDVSLRNFYMRRVLRLAPALLFLLLVYSVLSVILLKPDQAKTNLIDSLIALFYAANWARAFNIHPPDFLGHTWSLSIEEQFYILWPVTLIFLLRRIKDRWHVAAVVAAIAVAAWGLRIYMTSQGYPVDRVYNGLDSRADALLVGCVLGVVLASNLIGPVGRARLTAHLRYIAPLSVLGLLGVAVSTEWFNPHMYYWLFFLIEVLTALILLALFVEREGRLGAILSSRWIVWTGSISYGLYLWHFPVYRTMVVSGFGSEIERLTVGILITFVFATLSYYFLERSFLQMKERYA